MLHTLVEKDWGKAFVKGQSCRLDQEILGKKLLENWRRHSDVLVSFLSLLHMFYGKAKEKI